MGGIKNKASRAVWKWDVVLDILIEQNAEQNDEEFAFYFLKKRLLYQYWFEPL